MAQEIIGLLFGVEGVGVDGASGKLIVNALTDIVNDINAGKSNVPKIKLQFDTSEASKVIGDLTKTIGNVKNSSSKVGGNLKKGLQSETAKFLEYQKVIKQWIKDSKTAAKLSAEYSDLSRKHDGSIVGNEKGYTKTIDAINKTAAALSNLQFKFATLDDVQNGLASKEGDLFSPNESEIAAIASAVGITEEQYKSLFAQMQAGSTQASQNIENANRKNEQSWTATSSKIRDEVQRTYDTIAKDPNVKKMADDIIQYSQSAEGSVGDLKNKYDELRNAIHESGADVETWGDKFKKTFAGKVRSALAGAITAKFTQYLHEIYQNVVNIDKALVNLQIASGKSRAETKELIKEYSGLAKQLGATTTEVAEAADTWLRQGYKTEEATTLITNSMMLSKLGQMESTDASTALTSAMKGYGVTVEDSIKIVDKLTKVDMEAAASAGDIATAMAETATSARLSGVSMDKLIGYLTTVKEVTQDGSESVGVFFKTLFARMNNVKAGKFIDDETGESLNDVEAVLGKLQISLRSANGEFRDSSDVLDEVADRWRDFNDKERNAIATAMAGSRQFEKFNVLMENYTTAMGYATTATNAGGTAMEKFSAYTDGIGAKLSTLQATFEELSLAVLNSEWVTTGVEVLTRIVEALTSITSAGDGVVVAIVAISAAILLLNAAFEGVKSKLSALIIKYAELAGVQTTGTITTKAFTAALLEFSSTGLLGVITFIPRFIVAVVKYVASLIKGKLATDASTASNLTFKASLDSMNISINASKLAIGSLVAVIGICCIAVNSYNQAVQDSINNSLSAASAANAEGKEYLKNAESIDELIDEYEKLAKANGGVFSGESAEKVKGIQQKITDLVGTQADKIDLVNGKLDEEIKKMRELAIGPGGAVDAAIKKGETEIALAKNAYETMMSSFMSGGVSAAIDGEAWVSTFGRFSGGVTEFTKEWTDKFKVSLSEVQSLSKGFGLVKGGWYGLQYEFDTIEEFVQQYERIAAMQAELAGEHGDTSLFKSASAYITEYKNIYEQYVAGKLLIDEANKTKLEIENPSNGNSKGDGVSVELKSIIDILEEIQSGYDGIADAFSNVTEEGYLTAGALSSLLQLEKEQKLAGLTLADICEQDANGFKLKEDALQQYVQAVIAANTVEGEFETAEDKNNYIANLENLRRVLATLIATQEEATDASKTRREELEKEQEMYEEQLDKFEELIDLRKDLLQTYKDELDYQKELEDKQRNVSSLQTKLAVARLDNSAAGQARVRELEAELKEAQEDLDDFTLEHAIDILTEQLDSTNSEWKNIVQSKLDDIKKAIEGLDITPNVNIDTSWAQEMFSKITAFIDKAHGTDFGGGGTDGGSGGDEAADGTHSTGSNTVPFNIVQPSGYLGSVQTQQSGSAVLYRKYPTKRDGFLESTGIDIGGIALSKDEYNSNVRQDPSGNTYIDLHKIRNGRNYPTPNWWAKLGEGYSIEETTDGYTIDIHSFKPVYKFHQGGIVDGAAPLHDTEVFAKLLKGEFVTTPAQMKRFMEQTLPQIANYTASGGTNEFNAPLIEITCASVTTEAIPELERVVNDAVREIQKQLDSGMSRTGYKRPRSKRLT